MLSVFPLIVSFPKQIEGETNHFRDEGKGMKLVIDHKYSNMEDVQPH